MRFAANGRLCPGILYGPNLNPDVELGVHSTPLSTRDEDPESTSMWDSDTIAVNG